MDILLPPQLPKEGLKHVFCHTYLQDEAGGNGFFALNV